jgi:hypothetical protein
MFTLSLHCLLIKLRQADIRQDDPLTGIHRSANPAGNDFDPLRIFEITLIIFIEGPDAFIRDTGAGGVRCVRAKSDINPGFPILIEMAGLEDTALWITADAQHQGHELVQRDLHRTSSASEVELGGLRAAEVAPEMIPFVIGLDRGNRLSRKKGDPVQAVEAPFRDQVSVPDIRHRPLVAAIDFTHEDSTSH